MVAERTVHSKSFNSRPRAGGNVDDPEGEIVGIVSIHAPVRGATETAAQ